MVFLAFAIISFVVLTDQFTKYIVLDRIGELGRPVAVVDNFFYIVCHRNSGAAFGILQGGRLFLIIVTPLLIAALFVFLFRIKNTFFRIALSFVIGGAIGNYIDRFMAGGVVDFLDFYIFGYNFPTFNAADSSIVLGTALLIVYSLRYKEAKPAPGEAKDPGGDD